MTRAEVESNLRACLWPATWAAMEYRLQANIDADYRVALARNKFVFAHARRSFGQRTRMDRRTK